LSDGDLECIAGKWREDRSKTLPQLTASPSNTNQATDSPGISARIVEQGEKVRLLKAAKGGKSDIDAAVKILLELKAQFKKETGADYKPGVAPPANTQAAAAAASIPELDVQITKQGDIVRQLKTDKASKQIVDEAVKVLLELKQKYKSATGKDWKPTPAPPVQVLPSAAPLSDSSSLSSQIADQGNLVRKLKSDKANKADIDSAVKILLEAKKQYKAITGKDWTANDAPITIASSNIPSPGDSNTLSEQITQQGNKVRDLKAKKSDKNTIEEAVKALLTLKENFKNLTGTDWQPSPVPAVNMSTDLNGRITAQGNIIRDLKAAKAEKRVIDEEVKSLIALKAEFKNTTGQEWKPAISPPSVNVNNVSPDLNDSIIAQGNKIRDLKAEKAGKSVIDEEVKTLLSLKSEFKNKTGQDWKPAEAPSRSAAKEKTPVPKNDKKPKKEEKKVEKEQPQVASSSAKKQSRLGLEAKKEENLSDWYSQVSTQKFTAQLFSDLATFS